MTQIISLQTFSGIVQIRDLVPEKLTGLVKDVFNSLRDGGTFTLAFVKSELEMMGWPESIMDEKGLDIVMSLFDYSINNRVNE